MSDVPMTLDKACSESSVVMVLSATGILSASEWVVHSENGLFWQGIRQPEAEAGLFADI